MLKIVHDSASGKANHFKVEGLAKAKRRPQITNVHVDCVSHDGAKAAAGFTFGDHRFHIWFNPKTMQDEGVLHRNPIKELKGELSQHYGLDPAAAKNAPLLAEMWRQIEEGGMIAEAIRIESYEQVRDDAEIENERIDRYLKLCAEARIALARGGDPDPTHMMIHAIADAMEWSRSQ